MSAYYRFEILSGTHWNSESPSCGKWTLHKRFSLTGFSCSTKSTQDNISRNLLNQVPW